MGNVKVIHHASKVAVKPVTTNDEAIKSGSTIDGVSCSLAEKIRVAAYCRVSTLQEEQELSYETQRDFYKAFIEKNPQYYLVDIYGDQGKSGLNAEGRPEFQRMMRDCRNGRIDHIFTKSVSRFARNYSECLEFIRELKALGVVVHFEKECFSTADANINMILSFIAILAQEEVNSFRYKKAVVLMGANATGKTSLGKALLKIITYDIHISCIPHKISISCASVTMNSRVECSSRL